MQGKTNHCCEMLCIQYSLYLLLFVTIILLPVYNTVYICYYVYICIIFVTVYNTVLYTVYIITMREFSRVKYISLA